MNKAIALYNGTDDERTITAELDALGYDWSKVSVWDCFEHRAVTNACRTFAVKVPAHGTRIYRLASVKPEVSAFKVGDGEVRPADNQWEGAKVAVFGDSITDPAQTNSQRVYWQYLSDWLKWKPAVFGISGHSWSDMLGQIDRAEKAMGDEVDAVTIFLGTNDYAGGVPLGRWYDIVDGSTNWWGKTIPMKHRVLNRDRTTLRGRINLALERVRNRWPKVRVILFTPIHREYFRCSETNVQPAEDWPNIRGLYIDDYVACIREAADIWGCAVVDLYRDSGLLPRLDVQHREEFRSFMTDGLHPNSAGHLRLAETIYYRLRSVSR